MTVMLNYGHFPNKGKMSLEEIEKKDNAFKARIDALDEMNSIRVEIAQLVKRVNNINTTHRSREKSIVSTNLEQAGLWLNQDIELNHQL